MISVQSSAPFTADALFGPSFTGLAGTVGVLLQDGSGNVVQARSTTGISEHPTGSGLYTCSFTAPATLGQYTLVWDTGGSSPTYAVEDVDVTLASPIYTPAAPMLVSVTDAQAWLRRSHASGQSASDDITLLTLAISGISQDIINYTEREPFDPTGTNADLARTLEYDGSGFLNLAPYDLRSITSITLAGQTLTATTGAGDGDYVPMPRNKNRWGTYDYLILRGYFKLGPSHFLSSPILRTRDLVITGKWGMTSVPPEMYLACLIAVDDHYRNPEQAGQRGSGEFQLVEAPRVPGSGGLPQGAIDELEPLRRVVF